MEMGHGSWVKWVTILDGSLGHGSLPVTHSPTTNNCAVACNFKYTTYVTVMQPKQNSEITESQRCHGSTRNPTVARRTDFFWLL